MKSEFNEMEFQTSFLGEVMRNYKKRLASPPIIPSLIEENRLGYDVQLPFNSKKKIKSIFIQFKVPNLSDSWNSFLQERPYFSFKVTRLSKSPQHNLLVKLAEKGNSVFYCSSLFLTRLELTERFSNDEVLISSRFFNPLEMGLLTENKQHYVIYNRGGNKACFQSEPREIFVIPDFKKVLNLATYFGEKDYVRLLDVLSGTYKEITEYSIEFPGKLQEFRRADLQRIRYILRKFFGLTWLLIEDDAS